MLLNQNLFRQRDKVLTLFSSLGCNDYFTITTFHSTHGYLTIDFRYDCRVRWITCLEQLGHTRQTTGDITTLGSCTRNLNKCLTSLQCLTIIHDDVSTYREVIRTLDFAISTDDIACRNLRLILRFCYNLLSQAGSIIGFCTISNTLNNLIELQSTSVFSYNDCIKWIPLGNLFTLGNHIALLMIKRRTIRYIHRRKHNLGVRIYETNLTQTAHNHLALFTIFLKWYSTQFLEFNFTIILSHYAGIGSCIGSHTTGMERTKRKLSTWFTNSLCSNHAACLTSLYHLSGSKVTTITFHADTLLALTSKYGTDFHTFYRALFYCVSYGLSNFFASCYD